MLAEIQFLQVNKDSNRGYRSGFSLHNSNYGHEDVGQHAYRRSFWMSAMMLPIASIALTLSTSGPPTHVMVPVIFAAIILFSGTMVLSECYLMLMDNYDISDLPEPFQTPGSGSMTQGVDAIPHGRTPATHRPASIHPNALLCSSTTPN